MCPCSTRRCVLVVFGLIYRDLVVHSLSEYIFGPSALLLSMSAINNIEHIRFGPPRHLVTLFGKRLRRAKLRV
jgi:hypothetical protein